MKKQYGEKPVILLNTAHLYFLVKKTSTSIKYYKKLTKTKSAIAVVGHIYLAKIYHMKKRIYKSLYHLSKALEVKFPNFMKSMVLEQLEQMSSYEPRIFNQAKRHFFKKKYQKAHQGFHYAWLLSPIDSTLFMKVYSSVKLNMPDRAMEEAEQIEDDKLYQEAS